MMDDFYFAFFKTLIVKNAAFFFDLMGGGAPFFPCFLNLIPKYLYGWDTHGLYDLEQ